MCSLLCPLSRTPCVLAGEGSAGCGPGGETAPPCPLLGVQSPGPGVLPCGLPKLPLLPSQASVYFPTWPSDRYPLVRRARRFSPSSGGTEKCTELGDSKTPDSREWDPVGGSRDSLPVLLALHQLLRGWSSDPATEGLRKLHPCPGLRFLPGNPGWRSTLLVQRPGP